MTDERRHLDSSSDGRGIDVAIVILVMANLVLAWTAAVVLEPKSDDGFAMFFGTFWAPMVVTAIVIQLLGWRVISMRRIGRGIAWWWLVVLPLGTVLTAIPQMARDPEYFELDGGFWPVVAVLGMSLLLVVLSYVFGALLWFFFVMPAVMVVLWFTTLGDRPRASGLYLPAGLIALGVTILVLANAVNLGSVGRSGTVAAVFALLGLPGGYTVESETGLWIARAMLVVIIAPGIVMFVRHRIRRASGVDAADGASAADGAGAEGGDERAGGDDAHGGDGARASTGSL